MKYISEFVLGMVALALSAFEEKNSCLEADPMAVMVAGVVMSF
jgi:hypothetical protein